jgi:hypothetical protein
MSKPLVVFLNEVAGGRKLIEAVRERAGDAKYIAVVSPQNQPAVGQLFDPDEANEAATARVEVTLAVLDEFGIEAVGEVLDPESDLALGDAIRSHRPSEVLVSNIRNNRFGATRRDLVEWAEREFEPGVKVTHIPVRLKDDSLRLDLTHTLVVANQTLPSPDLVERLLGLAKERPHRFTIIAPAAEGVSGATVSRHLAELMAELYRHDIDATGQPMSSDPFLAVKEAIEHYHVDDVLISTLPGEESRWLESDLIGRVREITDKPVAQHESGRAPGAIAADVAHGEVSEAAGTEEEPDAGGIAVAEAESEEA